MNAPHDLFDALQKFDPGARRLAVNELADGFHDGQQR